MFNINRIMSDYIASRRCHSLRLRSDVIRRIERPV